MEFLALLSDIPAAAWVALSAAFTGLGGWLTLRAKSASDGLTAEIAERSSFRAALMGDITGLRAAIKVCEDDRERIRGRLFTAEEKIIQMTDSISAQQRWIELFKTREIDRGAALPPARS